MDLSRGGIHWLRGIRRVELDGCAAVSLGPMELHEQYQLFRNLVIDESRENGIVHAEVRCEWSFVQRRLFKGINPAHESGEKKIDSIHRLF
jgi:hypothetical protein